MDGGMPFFLSIDQLIIEGKIKFIFIENVYTDKSLTTIIIYFSGLIYTDLNNRY